MTELGIQSVVNVCDQNLDGHFALKGFAGFEIHHAFVGVLGAIRKHEFNGIGIQSAIFQNKHSHSASLPPRGVL